MPRSSRNDAIGIKSNAWHNKANFHKLVKLLDVTPNISVNKDPHSVEITPPKFVIDINRAYNVASTPLGQSRAPKTTIGIVTNCDTRVMTTRSANANTKSGMPISRFTCKINRSIVFSKKKDKARA